MQFNDNDLGRSSILRRPHGQDRAFIPSHQHRTIAMSDFPVTSPCPCTSGANYGDCCGPLHAGTAFPPTAEALMRSRYCAYVVKDVDYIERTDHPDRRGNFDRAAAEQWATLSEWQGLDIIATERGQAGDDTGLVEFRARFKLRGKDHSHSERSTFAKVDGRWFYVDGTTPEQKPFIHEKPAVGRNDPCACGSGKKFKKCCGK